MISILQKHIFLPLVALGVLASCSTESDEEIYLANVRKLTTQILECESQKVLASDCDELMTKEKKLRLEFQLKHDSEVLARFKERYQAAVELGKLEAKLKDSPSVYELVNTAYEQLHRTAREQIQVQDYNYLIFDPVRCREQPKRTYYQKFNERTTTKEGSYVPQIVFYKLPSTQCFNAKQIQTNYMIISEEQLTALKTSADRNDRMSIKSFETWNEADNWEPVYTVGKSYMAENAKKPGVTTTESGLQYEVLSEGPAGGVQPKEDDIVEVHYHGTLVDGTIFDSSVGRGGPVFLPLNRVIPGWAEGVQLMSVGDKFRFVVPPELAYGDREVGDGAIPAKSTVIFEVELIDVKIPRDDQR